MIEVVFPATDSVLADVLSLAEGELERVGCPMKTAMQVAVCLEEIFVNIAHYAYEGAEGTAGMQLDCGEHFITITLTDEGMAFDPLAREDPDVSLSVEERSVGGLGIYMVKKTMDEVFYERRDGKNVFTMKKYF